MTFTARQSTLRGFEVCGRRTWHDIQAGEDSIRGFTEASADLGTVMHLIGAEILRTLHEQTETQMPTQEAVEIAYSVYAKCDIVLPTPEREDMIWLTLRFVERPWKADRLLPTELGPAIEQRIFVPIVCQDGQTRILSCQPDAIFHGGGATAVIADWKSGRGKPKQPKQPQPGVPENTAIGKKYLSARGHFQADCYSLATMHRWPAVERVIFRELHLRSGQIREAILGRDEMEHVARQIGVHLQKLERALGEGEDSKAWPPRPGGHCARQCPVARSCPVPPEQRGVGAIEDDDMADAEAGRWVMLDGLCKQMRLALKERYQATGRPHRVGDGTMLAWSGGAGNAFQVLPEEDVPA